MSKDVRKFKEVTHELLLAHIKNSIGRITGHTVRVSGTAAVTRTNDYLGLDEITGTTEIVGITEDKDGFTVIIDVHEQLLTHTFVYRNDDDTLAAVLLRTALFWED